MSKSKHTPAPWKTKQEYIDGNELVTTIYSSDPFTRVAHLVGDNQRANENLMTVAPELLTRLESALKTLIADRDCFFESVVCGEDEIITNEEDRDILAKIDEEIDLTQAVIAKAKGKA